jgi:hypothetical protein
MFSGDDALRLQLSRSWGQAALSSRPRSMAWVMLNPSTADAIRDDATIRRCAAYAEREGCTILRVVNLVPTVATLPADLLPDACPAWWEGINTEAISMACLPGDLHLVPPLVMLGWGRHAAAEPRLAERAQNVLHLLDAHHVPAWCLGWTKNGQPVHPLRQRADAPLLPANDWARGL